MITKGPWQVIEDPIDVDKWWVCDCVKVVPVGYTPIVQGACGNESDALAIAAVPELLDALKLTVCEGHPGDCDDCQFCDEFQTCSDKQYKIKAVLKKAGIEI